MVIEARGSSPAAPLARLMRLQAHLHLFSSDIDPGHPASANLNAASARLPRVPTLGT